MRSLAIRIKTIYGDTGSVSEVTYHEIAFSDATDYGIVIEQNYDDTSKTPTTGVPITDFVLENIIGTCEDDDCTEIYIACGDGSCSDWTWSGVSVTGGKVSDDCLNVPSGISCDL